MHAPLHEHLEGAVAYLDAALTSGGRVCAFCHDGRSTAPAVVAFYLMRRRQMSLAAALDAIYAARPDAQPNVGFWQRLVEAESWLRGGEDGDGEAPAAAVVDGPPSVSLQQYKWRFLRRQQQERAKPNEPMETEEDAAAAEARARAAMMQQLELGKAEVAELIRVNSEASWTSAGFRCQVVDEWSASSHTPTKTAVVARTAHRAQKGLPNKARASALSSCSSACTSPTIVRACRRARVALRPTAAPRPPAHRARTPAYRPCHTHARAAIENRTPHSYSRFACARHSLFPAAQQFSFSHVGQLEQHAGGDCAGHARQFHWRRSTGVGFRAAKANSHGRYRISAPHTSTHRRTGAGSDDPPSRKCAVATTDVR